MMSEVDVSYHTGDVVLYFAFEERRSTLIILKPLQSILKPLLSMYDTRHAAYYIVFDVEKNKIDTVFINNKDCFVKFNVQLFDVNSSVHPDPYRTDQ